MTCQSSDSAIYIDIVMARQCISNLICKYAPQTTRKDIRAHPISILQGTDEQVSTNSTGLDIFIKWEKHHTEVWTRNCRRIVQVAAKPRQTTKAERLSRSASQCRDLRTMFSRPSEIPDRNDRSTMSASTRTLESDSYSSQIAPKPLRNNIKPPDKEKGHREDDKVT
jgi:hypothetical protein